MKQLKVVVISAAIGIAIGLWLGVNIGREMPWYANPFHTETLSEKLRRVGGETLEKSGKALENTGRSLQDQLSK